MMDSTTVIIVIAAATLQTVTVWAWITARTDAREWKTGCEYATRMYDILRANSHRRDPKTGRLLPLGE